MSPQSPQPPLHLNRPCHKWPEVEPLIHKVVAATLGQLTAKELQGLNPATVELGVTLANDKQIRRYNRQYRAKDAPTNILSFALNDGESTPQPMVGDLILALQTIQKEAKEQGKSFEDHLSHLLVHGILHLFGYDHERSKKETKRQEAREITILASWGQGNPYITGKKKR